ncbi:MAG: ribosome-binding factor A [Pseudomonadota bacterium]|nr:ribosome-binding factor A [Pseudomonadota bacterium]
MSAGVDRRVLRVQKSIRDILSLHLISKYQTELSSMISIPDVKVSPDLRHAKVLVSCLGQESLSSPGASQCEKVTQLLNENIRDIQSHLAHQLNMKFCPRIQFLPDQSYKIFDRLKEISQDQ